MAVEMVAGLGQGLVQRKDERWADCWDKCSGRKLVVSLVGGKEYCWVCRKGWKMELL
jgi:hypothetical protein